MSGLPHVFVFVFFFPLFHVITVKSQASRCGWRKIVRYQDPEGDRKTKNVNVIVITVNSQILHLFTSPAERTGSLLVTDRLYS